MQFKSRPSHISDSGVGSEVPFPPGAWHHALRVETVGRKFDLQLVSLSGIM